VTRFTLVLDDEAEGALKRLVACAERAAKQADARGLVTNRNALIAALIVDAAEAAKW
jgi:hypothetical protein